MKLTDALRDEDEYECTNYSEPRYPDRFARVINAVLWAVVLITGPLTIAAQIWRHYHHR